MTKALAEWMVLIELCKDLLARVETYEITFFIDALVYNKQIESGWQLEKQKENLKSKVKSTFSTLTSFLSPFAHHVAHLCEITGVTEHFEETIKHIAIGFVQSHPGAVISTIVGLWFGKL